MIDPKIKSATDFFQKIESFQCGDTSICVALRRILKAINNFIPYRYANIWLVNEHRNFKSISFPATLSLICSSGNDEEIAPIDYVYLELRNSFAGKAILQNDIIRCSDIKNENIFKNKKLVKLTGANALISIPFFKASWLQSDTPIGVINLYFEQLPKISNHNLKFIAHNVSNSIERLKLIHKDIVTSRLLPYSEL